MSWEILGASRGCGENRSHVALARTSHEAPLGCKMARNYVPRKEMK